MTNNTTSRFNSYADALAVVVNLARLGKEIVIGLSDEAALDMACKSVIRTAQAAKTRTQEFRFETSSRDIEDAFFLGNVGREVKDGFFAPGSFGGLTARHIALAVLENNPDVSITEFHVREAVAHLA